MTRDNDLNGLEHYERFLEAQRFDLTVQEQDLFHKALRRSVRPVITSKEPAAPMTRDKTTNPGAPMSDIAAELERLVAIAKDGPHKFSRQQSAGDVTACLRGNIDTIIAALRAAGEVERMREALLFLETEDIGDGAFAKWMDELNEQVIQGEYGYEEGEFAAYPSLWVFSFAKGYTPSEAFKRACASHSEERERKFARRALAGSAT